MSGPLDGVNVLEMCTAAVGPWAVSQLAALGASVVKVEDPEGDRSLLYPPDQKGISVFYTFCNMNKRAIRLDLKEEGNRVHVERLVREADILIENFRPGKIAALGFGYERVRELNPKIVYVSAPGWGEEGPLRDEPGQDPGMQMFTGFAAMNGIPGDRPERVRHPHLDFNASCHIAAATLLALLAREATGQGQRVVIPQLGSTLSLQVTRVAEYFATGVVPRPAGSACTASVPNQAFQCQDKKYLAVAAESDRQWTELCRALGAEDLAADPRFTTNLGRVAHREELVPLLEAIFRSRPARWWCIKLCCAGVPHGFFLDFDALLHDSHCRENGHIVELDIPHQGTLYTGGLPWDFCRTPVHYESAPYPGQHNTEVLRGGFGRLGAFHNVRGESLLEGSQKQTSGAQGPLAGLRVVDVTQGICGPYLSLLLGFAGAEVIKVEPPEGDYARSFAPPCGPGSSAAFTILNQHKKSIALDLQRVAGRRMLRDLIKTADVFLEDLGPGRAKELGVGYQRLKALNPRLVYGSISPFGERGPLRDRPGGELVIQATSGIWTNLGCASCPPLRVGADVASIGTAILGLTGVLSALYHRARRDQGQRVAISMLGAMHYMEGAQWMSLSNPDAWDGVWIQVQVGRRLHGYRTLDGTIELNLHRGTEEDFLMLAAELGMEEAFTDPRFAEGAREALGRGKYADELVPIWEKAFMKHTTERVIEMIRRHRGTAIRLRTYEEAFKEPQVDLIGMVEEIDYPPGGKTRVLVPPWDFAGFQHAAGLPPELGQHTEEVLRWLGDLSPEQVAKEA